MITTIGTTNNCNNHLHDVAVDLLLRLLGRAADALHGGVEVGQHPQEALLLEHLMYECIYIYIHTYVYLYIYIERER